MTVQMAVAVIVDTLQMPWKAVHATNGKAQTL